MKLSKLSSYCVYMRGFYHSDWIGDTFIGIGGRNAAPYTYRRIGQVYACMHRGRITSLYMLALHRFTKDTARDE